MRWSYRQGTSGMHTGMQQALLPTASSAVYLHDDEMLPGGLLNGVYSVLKRA
jgi:hypothetical protein